MPCKLATSLVVGGLAKDYPACFAMRDCFEDAFSALPRRLDRFPSHGSMHALLSFLMLQLRPSAFDITLDQESHSKT